MYFVLFGRLVLQVPGDTPYHLGRVNIGWSVGEEVLFDPTLQIRQESCFSETESCLLGIHKTKLAVF